MCAARGNVQRVDQFKTLFQPEAFRGIDRIQPVTGILQCLLGIVDGKSINDLLRLPGIRKGVTHLFFFQPTQHIFTRSPAISGIANGLSV